MPVLCLAAMLLAIAAHAVEQTPEAPLTVSVTSTHTRALNIAEITYKLVLEDMGESEWLEFVNKARTRFGHWSTEFDNNNMKQFLDDRLLALAPRVTSGKGAALCEFCQWLALYHLFGELPPSYIRDIPDRDKEWIQEILSKFDWNSAAKQIRAKARS